MINEIFISILFMIREGIINKNGEKITPPQRWFWIQTFLEIAAPSSNFEIFQIGSM